MTSMGAAETFASRIGEVLDAGAIAVMISIGHRTGLFDVLAALPPSTSTQIAERAALAERYVREWLASMVTGGIVAFDPSARTYRLPPEHAACLTRGAPWVSEPCGAGRPPSRCWRKQAMPPRNVMSCPMTR
jgi:hypothetical protein